jgi:hypothetical protein
MKLKSMGFLIFFDFFFTITAWKLPLKYITHCSKPSPISLSKDFGGTGHWL